MPSSDIEGKQVRKIIFYIHYWHYLQNMVPIIDRLEDEKVDYLIITFAKRDDSFESIHRRFGDKVKILSEIPFFKAVSRLTPLRGLGILIQLTLSLFWFTIFFLKERPSKLILSDDRHFWVNIILKVSKRFGIESILFPTESIQYEDDRIHQRFQQGMVLGKRDENRLSWKIIKRFYPANIRHMKGKIIFWYNNPYVLYAFLLGLLSKNPWIRGFNRVSRVAVNSYAQKEENILHGMPESKQVLTGFPNHDLLVECLKRKDEIKEEILGKQGIKGRRKVCLIIGAAHYQLWPKEEHPEVFRLMGELLMTLFDNIGKDHEIIFKVHPRQNLKDFIDRMEQHVKGNVHYFKNEYSIYELLAISDIAIMFISSTVVGSLLIDAPILAYHLHRINKFRITYDRYPSVEQIESLEELKEILRKINNKERYMKDLAKRRLKDREMCCMYDGKSTDRVLDMIFDSDPSGSNIQDDSRR